MPDCVTDADCDDGDNCTIDVCAADGTCEVESTTDPDDGDLCTADSCDDMGNPLNEAIDPDDMNPCTFDRCDPTMGESHPTERVLFESDFSSMAEWTAGGQWQIGAAEPSPISRNFSARFSRDPSEDHTGTMDNMLAGIRIGAFALTNLGTSYLESSPFDATISEGAIVLSYWRYLVSDYQPFMINTVEVYDGTTWQVVFSSGNSPAWYDSGWTRVTHDITPYANANLQVRFGLEVADTGAYNDVPSWSVDDVRVRHVPTFVDDNDACTEDTCDPVMGAVNVPVDLDDMDACTVDMCDPVRGVTHRDESIRLWTGFDYDGGGFSTGPEWQVGPAVAGGSTDPGMDTSPTQANRVAGVNLGGNYDTSTGIHDYYWLTSGTFDGTQMAGGMLELTFQRWLTSDYTPYVNNRIEVWDGTTWQLVWESGPAPGINDMSWMPQTYDLSAHASTSNRIRFGFNIDSGGVVARGGWNLDDIQVRATGCDP